MGYKNSVVIDVLQYIAIEIAKTLANKEISKSYFIINEISKKNIDETSKENRQGMEEKKGKTRMSSKEERETEEVSMNNKPKKSQKEEKRQEEQLSERRKQISGGIP